MWILKQEHQIFLSKYSTGEGDKFGPGPTCSAGHEPPLSIAITGLTINSEIDAAVISLKIITYTAFGTFFLYNGNLIWPWAALYLIIDNMLVNIELYSD
jgi:hypothetical protein